MTVSGLLVNANGDPNELATRGGAVLTNPFSFKEFYNSYAQSWRVSPRQSMLNACGKVAQSGLPTKPFDATDLKPTLAAHTKAICVKAGVRDSTLLDDCMIDVAFTGKASAAKIYTTMSPPVAVGAFQSSGTSGGGGG